MDFRLAMKHGERQARLRLAVLVLLSIRSVQMGKIANEFTHRQNEFDDTSDTLTSAVRPPSLIISNFKHKNNFLPSYV
jgi:hypothetical protein